MSFVLVVDQERTPLDPVHPGRARLLLNAGKAAVLYRFPFTIILKAAGPATHQAPLRVKIDPGSKTTGIAVVNDASGQVVWAGELAHRGEAVKARLDQRRACRFPSHFECALAAHWPISSYDSMARFQMKMLRPGALRGQLRGERRHGNDVDVGGGIEIVLDILPLLLG
jgi:RRXRR protein